MATFSVRLPCTQGGRTLITLNLCCERTGSNNDRHGLRIVRRHTDGSNQVILLGAPDIELNSNKDAKSWTWIDGNVPETRDYDYILQINRREGNGTYYEMVLYGIHYKK
jgi:hypothetical protein